MSRLQDYAWKLKYTPADGDLLHAFYIPLLLRAKSYDRASGYFGPDTFIHALQGIEGLIANQGKMRLITGCELGEAELAAIRRGEAMAKVIDQKLLACPLPCDSPARKDALELLAWLIEHAYLTIRIGIPCDPMTGKPLSGIFHEKEGIVADKENDRLAFAGSLNETAAGWLSHNWDTFHVYRSWRGDNEHLEYSEQTFNDLWHNKYKGALVLPVSEAVTRRLLANLPPKGKLPARLAEEPDRYIINIPLPEEAEREKVWRQIREGAQAEQGGKWVGMATAAIHPWPHQIRAFSRMYDNWPPRLLIADEVGLGKTIQAGLLLRQAILAKKAKRVLIMTPKAVLNQWQLELREKFNLYFPIYEDNKLRWPDGSISQPEKSWHQEPFLLASSELLRMRRQELTEQAEDWDLIILDEAHHARRKGANIKKDQPNQLLRLMRKLKNKTSGLILLTATPMQVAPVEVWDLLDLLGLPKSWTCGNFLRFYELIRDPNPDNNTLEQASCLYREMLATFGQALPEMPGIAERSVRQALADRAASRRMNLDFGKRKRALAIMAANAPTAVLISRHTRELLRNYRRQGKLKLNMAERDVEDRIVSLSLSERLLYKEVEEYISEVWNKAAESERSSVGFVLTVYRRRLASSFAALAATLRNRLANIGFSEEDLPDDDLAEEYGEAPAAGPLEGEKQEIESLLAKIALLPQDSKARELLACLAELKADGYKQAMIFTQYTDTLDWLSGELAKVYGESAILRYSGRGGETWQNGQWRIIERETARQMFKEGKASLLLCNEAAAEGLNFQFCGALINYDMPWNPMRVEQRIGRIDRLGQEYERIKIINLMYANTVETDIYLALRTRIKLFGEYVGRLQPILSALPQMIGQAALSGQTDPALARIEAMLTEAEDGFDLDKLTGESLEMPCDMKPAWGMDLLAKILDTPALLPPGYAASRLGPYDWQLHAPGRKYPERVCADADFYENHCGSVTLWSPGSPLFPEKL